MINSELGQAGFKIGIFLVVASGLMSLITDKGTAEHVISLFTLLIGVLLMVVITILVRSGRKLP